MQQDSLDSDGHFFAADAMGHGALDSDSAGEPFKTRWSLLMDAGAESPQVRRQAVQALLDIYSPVIRQHLARTWQLQPHDVDDMFQEFVAVKVLPRDFFARATPSRGRFRNLLFTAVDNFVRDQFRSRRPESFGVVSPETPDQAGEDPQRQFDRLWALTLIIDAFDHLRQHCLAIGKWKHWVALRRHIVRPLFTQTPAPPVAETAALIDQTSHQARGTLASAKRMLQAIIQDRIGGGVVQEDVREEVLDLQDALSGRVCLNPPPDLQQRIADLVEIPGSTARAETFKAETKELSEVLELTLDWQWSLLLELPLKEVAAQFELPWQELDGHLLLHDLIQHGACLRVLRQLKRVGRERTRCPGQLPKELSHMVYLTAIAAAMVFHNQLISKTDPENTRRKLRRALEREWIEVKTKSLLRSALSAPIVEKNAETSAE